MTKQAQKTAETTEAPEANIEPKVLTLDEIVKNYDLGFDGVKTVSGRLQYGVEFDGAYHKDFMMRLSNVQDELETRAAGYIGEQYELAMKAKSFVQLGQIPLDEITVEMIGQDMIPDDYTMIYWAQEALLKKRLDASNK